jgi:hypothetical protein
MDDAKRLKRGNKTKANNHQRLSQKSGWVMADNSLDKTNINNLHQNYPQMASLRIPAIVTTQFDRS